MALSFSVMFITFNISRPTRYLSVISLIRIIILGPNSSGLVESRKFSSNVRMASYQENMKYLEVAKKLALQAGEVFKRAVQSEKTVETKKDKRDLVTEYDSKIENILVSGFNAEFPDHKIIAEESAAKDEKIPELTEAPTWLIDPIDGTTNFIHTFPHCCISIGLAVNKCLEVGLIYNPNNNEMYTAIRGNGAFLNNEQIRTSCVTELDKSLVNYELGLIPISRIRDIVIGRLEAITNAVQGVRCIGSAALGLAYVASGALDAFHMDSLQPWDVAAGQLIVEEAGGSVIDSRGGVHNFMKAKTTAAGTEELARNISKLIVETDLQIQRKRFKRVPSSSKLV